MLGLLPLIGAALGIGSKKEKDPLEELQKHQKQEAWRDARSNMNKITNDVNSAIQNGYMDSTNKRLNAGIKLSQAIQF